MAPIRTEARESSGPLLDQEVSAAARTSGSCRFWISLWSARPSEAGDRLRKRGLFRACRCRSGGRLLQETFRRTGGRRHDQAGTGDLEGDSERARLDQVEVLAVLIAVRVQ